MLALIFAITIMAAFATGFFLGMDACHAMPNPVMKSSTEGNPPLDTTYTILYCDGTSQTCDADLPEQPGYELLRKLVEPALEDAHMERVNVFHNGKYTDMFVDDSGALNGLPPNPAATAVYRNNVLTHQPESNADDLPEIYGTAVLFDRKVWF